MIKKVQILQNRILKMSSDMMDKERKLRDTEKLYTNLRDVLSKQPDPQAAANLNKVQNALRKRGEKLKVRNRIYIIYEKKCLFKEDIVCTVVIIILSIQLLESKRSNIFNLQYRVALIKG